MVTPGNYSKSCTPNTHTCVYPHTLTSSPSPPPTYAPSFPYRMWLIKCQFGQRTVSYRLRAGCCSGDAAVSGGVCVCVCVCICECVLRGPHSFLSSPGLSHTGGQSLHHGQCAGSSGRWCCLGNRGVAMAMFQCLHC